MSLRNLRAADASALERFVLMASFPPDRPRPPDASSTARVVRWLDNWPADGDVAVGWDEDGRLVGVALARTVEPVRQCTDDGLAIPELLLAVEEHHRGRGVGASLLAGIAERAREAACAALVATVSERNAPAVALYRAAGFRDVDHDSGPLIMRLEL